MCIRDSGGGFGPVIYFGQGGVEAEVINDLAYGLPPLNMHLAREIMAQTRIYQRLRYSLLRRANINALALTLVKISQMVIDLAELTELHINPVSYTHLDVYKRQIHDRAQLHKNPRRT